MKSECHLVHKDAIAWSKSEVRVRQNTQYFPNNFHKFKLIFTIFSTHYRYTKTRKTCLRNLPTCKYC